MNEERFGDTPGKDGGIRKLINHIVTDFTVDVYRPVHNGTRSDNTIGYG